MNKEVITECLQAIKYSQSQGQAIAIMTDMVTHNDGVQVKYVYTIGLTDLGLPEFIILTQHQESAITVLIDICEKMKANKVAYPDGWTDNEHIFASMPIQIRSLKPYQVHSLTEIASAWYEGKGKWPQFQQIVIHDRSGRLPDDPEFDKHFMQQHYGQPHLWELDTAPVLH